MRLFKPIIYLTVEHPEKRKYDFWLPAAFACAFTAIYIFLDGTIKFIESGGIVDSINQLLALLVGFFIAALAAVATFNSPSMDEKTLGKPFLLKENYKGENYVVELTRRRFLSLMFGYLSVLTIVLYVIGVAAKVFAPYFQVLVQENIAMQSIFVFIYINKIRFDIYRYHTNKLERCRDHLS